MEADESGSSDYDDIEADYAECKQGLENIVRQLEVAHVLLKSFSEKVTRNDKLVPTQDGVSLWKEYGLEVPSSIDVVYEVLDGASKSDIEATGRVTFGERLVQLFKVSSFDVFES